MDIIKSIEHEHLKEKIPVLKVGNTVRVHQRIKEGNRERIQVFEGIIIKKQGGGLNATFTVRRIASGVGVEKTFLIHSPLVEKVELVRVGKARRAKLYYLRDRVGKAAKTKEQIGARIEDKEITVKATIEEEPVVEEKVEAPVEEAKTVETEATPVEEVKTEEAPKAEEPAKEEVKEDATEETKKDEE
jgi:large subunit ribosomal protein L19